MTWLLSHHASYVKFFTLVSYPDGMNLDRIGGWSLWVTEIKLDWPWARRDFSKKKVSLQDHHAAEPLGRVGTQEQQEQGAISNRIPPSSYISGINFLLSHWSQLCFVGANTDEDSLCSMSYILFHSCFGRVHPNSALSLNISVASLSLSAYQCNVT